MVPAEVYKNVPAALVAEASRAMRVSVAAVDVSTDGTSCCFDALGVALRAAAPLGAAIQVDDGGAVRRALSFYIAHNLRLPWIDVRVGKASRDGAAGSSGVLQRLPPRPHGYMHFAYSSAVGGLLSGTGPVGTGEWLGAVPLKWDWSTSRQQKRYSQNMH